MCMTAEAFGLFLSIISLSNVSVDEGRVTIHTPKTEVVWLALGSQWCVLEPGKERFAMNAPRKHSPA